MNSVKRSVGSAIHTTLGEYDDLYLESDVLLLPHVFENFRQTCYQYYKLDHGHYHRAPGLA